ncbi:FadR/GntR family transcriptional regulator [Streptomyces sp. NPDC056716]|uniref:FadR/GntR family transcriptional regulator n=1 Tax=unclassified Streptomyces TaxID=2593676 RepID=UPI00368F8A9F
MAREITKQIMTERLPEGTKLPTEREMLETYQVGRSTLREALRLLESRGVLTVRPGRDGGPVVRRPRPSDLGEALTLLMQFEGVPFVEVFAARQALEPILARMAAQNMDDETLTAMAGSIERMAADLDDRQLFREENFKFHELVASAARSPVLELFSAAVESVADGLAFGVVAADFTHGHRALALEAHRNLLKAFRARDPEAAEDSMRVHLEEARASWMAAYRELSRQPVQWSSVAAPGMRTDR